MIAVGFVKTLDKFIDYRNAAKLKIKRATVEVTEPYARRVLGKDKRAPLKYRGLTLNCIGSKSWRERHSK